MFIIVQALFLWNLTKDFKLGLHLKTSQNFIVIFFKLHILISAP